MGTFAPAAYNIYRSTFAPVDLSGRPINKAPVAGRTRYEDNPETSTEAPKRGADYYYVVVAVDAQGNPSAPSDAAKGSPVATLTGLSARDVEIPGTGGSTLSIAGMKDIKMGYTYVSQESSKPDNSAIYSAGVAPGFKIDQQLQVRLTGKVGRKIKVDVDYDDKALSTEQQKISVVYTGDSQEVFKEFAFGDILMDLNSGRTEFAGYNKSLFGAKVKLESADQKFRLTAVGAQTKGFTESKRIVGGFEQARTNNVLGRDILDTSFIAYRYYYLSRDKGLVELQDQVKPGSVQIWVDRPQLTNYYTGPNKRVVTPPTGAAFHFIQLSSGEDFTVDYATGLVAFRRWGVQSSDTLLVAFIRQNADGSEESVGYNGTEVDFTPANMVSNQFSGLTSNSAHLIQCGSCTGVSGYDTHMSFQIYSLNATNILDPKLDPDFKFIIYGSDQKAIYELAGRSDFSDVLTVDSKLGLMQFRTPFPFKKGNSSPDDFRMDMGTFSKIQEINQLPAGDVYHKDPPIHNFTIHMEYKSKVSDYSLRPSIIRGSEIITLDGRRLIRDQDYYLDYDFGRLVFNNPDIIKETSIIDATYEYLPFGGQFTSTIWGTRGEYDVAPNLSLGTTFLMNSSDAPLEAPELRSTPFSLALLDGDIRAQFSRERISDLLAPLLGGLKVPLAVEAKAEAAHAWLKPNTYNQHNETGVAMVDSFESVENSISTSVDENSWFPSSRPITASQPSGLARDDRQFSALVNEIQPGHDAQDRISRNENPNRTMMKINYSGFVSPSKWDSFVTAFSGRESSLATYTFIEMWVKVDADITLNVDVGQVDEDATDDNNIDTENANGFYSDSTDFGFLTGLSPYPGPSAAPGRYTDSHYWGVGNRTLDQEDVNSNGWTRHNSFYRFSRQLKAGTAGNNGFALVQIPLPSGQVFPAGDPRSTTPGAPNYFTGIHHVRLWFNEAVAAGGNIWMESLQFKGSRWEIRSDPKAISMGVPVPPDTYKFNVNAVNKKSAQTVAAYAAGNGYFDYQPNTDFFRMQVDTDADREQSLQLEYRVTNQDQTDGRPNYMALRKLTESLPLDMGNYENLRLDLFKPHANLPGEVLVLRLLTDENNYFQYNIQLDQVGVGSWHTQTLALDGSDGKRTVVGQPFLRTVRQAALAILTFNANKKLDDPRLVDGRELLWLDNLRLTDAQSREGTAYRINLNYDLGGLVQVNQDFREVESDFVRMDTQGEDPRRRERSHVVSATSSKIPKLPLRASWESRQYFTENLRREDPRYSRIFLDPDEDINRMEANAGFSAIPRLNIDTTARLTRTRRQFLPVYVQQQRQLLQDPNMLPHSDNSNFYLQQDYVLNMPDFLPVLRNDRFTFSWTYDETLIRFDQPTLVYLNFKDVTTRRRVFQGRYTGEYIPFAGLRFSPSYGHTFEDKQGNIAVGATRDPLYSYYSLGVDGISPEYQPIKRIINPGFSLSYDRSKGIQRPTLYYNFTQTRDYVQNELNTPGSLKFTTDLAVNEVLAGLLSKPFIINFSQEYTVDSQIRNDPRIRHSSADAQLRDWFAGKPPEFRQRYLEYRNSPTLDVAEGAAWWQPWWIREFFGSAEDTRDLYNIEQLAYRANRRATTNLGTSFDLPLAPGWTGRLEPGLTLVQTRDMTIPEQIVRQEQVTFRTRLNFPNPKLPFVTRYAASNLGVNFNRTYNGTKNADDRVTSERTSNDVSVDLPGNLGKLALGLRYSVGWSEDKTYSGAADKPAISTRNSQEPIVTANYFLDISKTVKLWDFWPFNGRQLRIKQSFKLDNSLGMRLESSGQEQQINIQQTDKQTYTLRNAVSYNMLDNVTGSLELRQDAVRDLVQPSNNFYSLSFTLGLRATF